METKNAKAYGTDAADAPLHAMNIKRRELLPQDVNGAFERSERGDVKYRFVVDTASLRNEVVTAGVKY